MDEVVQMERIRRLEKALIDREVVRGSGGRINALPDVLMQPYRMDCIGFIVCHEGLMEFTVNDRPFKAHRNQTVFFSHDALLQMFKWSPDFECSVLFYSVEPIKEVLGSTVTAMRIYAQVNTGMCDVWNTGNEDELEHYVGLLACYTRPVLTSFDEHERKLLLMALTYRLCSIYSNDWSEENTPKGRKMEIFMQLMQLIEQNFSKERSVAFYADKLCLSPKYLSSMVKSFCGYTVQEIVFKAILRRSIFLMKNSNKTIQEIANDMSFPNASAFGTFFKKQTGLSPMNYRKDVNS